MHLQTNHGQPRVRNVVVTTSAGNSAGTAAGRLQIPASIGDIAKRVFLGKPLITESLKSEKLSNPVALGALSPDAISSTAYGSEQILIELLPHAGLAAFALLLPITGVILLILVLVAASYRAGRHGLHPRGRVLHRRAGEFRAAGGAGRRRGTVDRLRGHRGGAVRSRDGCGGVGDPGIGSLQPGHHGRRGAVHLLCEPARLARSRNPIRAGDLRLRHHDRPDDRGRCRPRDRRGVTGIRPRPAARNGAGAAGQRAGHGRDDPDAAACVRQRRFVVDGSRGDLQYGRPFPKAAGAQRASGAHRHGLHSRVLVGRCRLPRPCHPRHAVRRRISVDAVGGRQGGFRSGHDRQGSLHPRPGRRPPPSCSPERTPASTVSPRWPVSSPKTASCRDS